MLRDHPTVKGEPDQCLTDVAGSSLGLGTTKGGSMLHSSAALNSSKVCRTDLAPGQGLLRSRRPSTRSRRPTLCVTAALGFFRKKIATAGAIDDLLAAIEGTNRGCQTSSSQRAKIDAAINVLEGAADRGNDFSLDLSATWKLLWTTEKVRLYSSP